MTSIKIKYRASRVGGKQGRLYYQVIHNRVIRQVKTEYRVFPEEWDDRLKEIRQLPEEEIRPEDARPEDARMRKERRDELLELQEKIACDWQRLARIVAVFNRKAVLYTADEVVSAFQHHMENNSLSAFMPSLVEQLKQTGRIRTSETYATTLSSFMRFRGGEGCDAS